jgi:gliding motility-associated-like protein
MKKILLALFILISNQVLPCHGMPLVNYNYVVGTTGVTINASSNASTCGCGPYYLEVEMKCTNTLNGLVPYCTGLGWNTYPWYRSLLNIPGYSAPGWFDNCVLEPYVPIFIPFSSLCPGQVYYFRARENVCGALGGPPGAWTAINSFTVPGTPILFTGSITTSTTTVCSGGSVVLTANPGGGCGTVAPGTLNTYDWLHIPGTNNPQTIVVTPTANTTYTCVIGNGCGQSVTLTAFIAVNGSIPLTPTIVNPLCFGNFGTVILPPSYSLYAWSANTSSTNTATYLAGTYSVSAVLNGCISTGTFALTNPPSLTLTPTASPSVICYNGISTLNANAVGGTAPYTYAWPPTSMTTGSFMVQPVNGTFYSVGVQDVNGCIAASSVSVSVLPPLQTNYSPTFGDICIGGTTTFTATGIAGNGGPYTYTWTPGGINTNTISVSPTVTTTYTLITSDGCSPNDTISVNVFVNVAPVATFTNSPLSGCELFDIEFGSTTFGYSNCVWNFMGVSTNSCNVSYQLPAGTYTTQLTVIGTNGCIGISPVATVTVFPKPNPYFYWTPEDPNILMNDITFYDQSTVGLPITKWHWDFGDIFVAPTYDTANTQNGAHTYNTPDTYPVKLIVTNSFGCIDSITRLLKIEDDYVIYIPNTFTPHKAGNNDVFKVSGIGFQSEGFIMSIYDRWGNMIYQTTDINKGWDGKIRGNILANTDTYVYRIKIKDYMGREKTYVGHIIVM